MTGARGPKSKPGAVRRNKPKGQTSLPAQSNSIPALPAGYSEETVAWWLTWVSSPQALAGLLGPTDWSSLLRCAKLVEAFNARPSAQLAAEIRQVESRLGGTAADRDRLGWKFDTSDPEPAPTAPGSRARKDPRVK